MKKEEILAICIEEIRSRKSTIEECVARYPELGKELRSLLDMAASLKPDEVIPSAEFKERTKIRLFKEMQPVPANVSRRLWSWRPLTPVRVLAWVLIALVIFGVAGGSTVYAAQSSLPGDILYPVKTVVENLQLAFTPDNIAKANLHIKLAQRRIDEATQQVKLNRNINVKALETVEQQLDDAIKELSDSDDKEATENILSRLEAATLDQQLELQQVMINAPEANKQALKYAVDITRRGNLVARVTYNNHEFLDSQPSVSDEKLDSDQFEISGILLSVQDRTWNVGGVILENVSYMGKVPATGIRVKAEGVIKNNEVYISRIEVRESSQETTKLEGQFKGTNQNGMSDVGGISIKIADNNGTQLRPGDNVQLQSNPNDDRLNVTNRQRPQGETNNSIQTRGVLMAVDIVGDVITVKTTGSQLTVNIREAQLENENGRKLNKFDLNRLVGKAVKLDGLYNKGKLLFVRQVRVDVED